jgi:hypothetical protein
VGSDSLTLTVQNIAGNKLDYYLDTALHLTGEREAGTFGEVRAEVVLTNTAPAGATEPRYVFGPFNEDQEAGLYRGAVSLYLPAGTTLVGTSGDPLDSPPVFQTEGGRPVIGLSVDVPAGSSRRILLDLRLPPRSPGSYELVLVPSPRVRPTQASIHLTGDATIDAAVVLDRTWRFRSDPDEPR